MLAAAAARQSGALQLQFQWTPAHHDIDHVVESTGSVEDWLGNAWANNFVKFGATYHMVAHTVSDSIRLALAEHKKICSFISWGGAPSHRVPEIRRPCRRV